MWRDRILEAKREKGISTKAMAEFAHMTEKSVGRILSGETPSPYVDSVIILGEAVGLAPTEVFGETGLVVGHQDLAVLEAEVARLTAELDALRAEMSALSMENELLHTRELYHMEVLRLKDEIIELYRQREQKTVREGGLFFVSEHAELVERSGVDAVGLSPFVVDAVADLMPLQPVEVSEADEAPLDGCELAEGGLDANLSLYQFGELRRVEGAERLQDGTVRLGQPLDAAEPSLDVLRLLAHRTVGEELVLRHASPSPSSACQSRAWPQFGQNASTGKDANSLPGSTLSRMV